MPMSRKINRTPRDDEDEAADPSDQVTMEIGEAVREAIGFAVRRGPGSSIQISIEEPDAGLVFVTVRPWARRPTA